MEMYNNRELLTRMSRLAPTYARNTYSLEASYGSFFSVLNRIGMIDKTGSPHKISFAATSAIIEKELRSWSDFSLLEKSVATTKRSLNILASALPAGPRRTIGKITPRRFKRWIHSR
jgi:hypothetical protein